jgi:hypothetical protein
MPVWRPVGFHNSIVGADLRFHAACAYSLITPPRIGRRLIRSRLRYAMDGSAVLDGVGGILNLNQRHSCELCSLNTSSTTTIDDRTVPVGEFGSDSEHESLDEAVRPRAARRYLHDFDASVGQDQHRTTRQTDRLHRGRRTVVTDGVHGVSRRLLAGVRRNFGACRPDCRQGPSRAGAGWCPDQASDRGSPGDERSECRGVNRRSRRRRERGTGHTKRLIVRHGSRLAA